MIRARKINRIKSVREKDNNRKIYMCVCVCASIAFIHHIICQRSIKMRAAHSTIFIYSIYIFSEVNGI